MRRIIAYCLFLVLSPFIMGLLSFYIQKNINAASRITKEFTPFSQATIYIDPVAGNDARNGTTPETAVQSLTKGASLAVSTRAQIIALSDTAHYGLISLNGWDGTSQSHKIITTYNLYGNGKAKVKGMKQLTDWTSLGNHLWSKSDASLPDSEYFQVTASTGVYPRYVYFSNGLLINGSIYGVARYPNTGALDMSGVSGDHVSYFEDKDLSLTDNRFADGWVYLNPVEFAIEKVRITSHTSTRINLDTCDWLSYDLSWQDEYKKIKYYLLNDPDMADQNGEWCYDWDSQTYTLYHTTNPSRLTIYASNVDSVLTLYNCDYIKVSNIEVQGGNVESIRIKNSNHVFIDSCNVRFSPYAGIFVSGSSNVYCRYDSILDAADNGVLFCVNKDDSPMSVEHCYIRQNQDMWYFGDRDGSHYNGIVQRFDEADINTSYNHIADMGYNGICWDDAKGENNGEVVCRGNLIENCNSHLGDGGGIYAFYSDDNVSKVICKNIIQNSGDSKTMALMGQNFSMGIYLDQGSHYWTIDSNTVYNVPMGIYNQYGTTHNTHRRNIIFKNDVDGYLTAYSGGYIKEGYGDDVTHFTWQYNTVIGSVSKDVQAFLWTNDGSPSAGNSTIDNNDYFTPFRTDHIVFKSKQSDNDYTYTMSNWRAFTGWENNSTLNKNNWRFDDVSGIKEDQFVRVFRNWSDTNHNFSLGSATFKDLDGNNVSTSVNVAPYQSKVLFYSSGSLAGVDHELFKN